MHLRCDDAIPMRRPLSIMRVDPEAGWIEVLFKVIGHGLEALATKLVGDEISSMGPIGCGFTPSAERPRALLIGGGVGIPPMIFLAENLVLRGGRHPLVLAGSEIPFPFELTRSAHECPGLPAGVDQSLKLLDDWGVPSRLASLSGFDGVYAGYVTEAADAMLGAMPDEQRKQVQVFACGPTPMLSAVAQVAARYELPAQVSLEEYMACAVGGCAGCTVAVTTDDGPAMKRVCVDGPVFEAAAVFPQPA